MKRILALFAVSALVACGGNNKPSDGGPPVKLPTGSGSASITIQDAGALLVGPVQCTVNSQTVQVSGIMFGFSTASHLCDFVRQTKMCGNKASSTMIGLQIAKGSSTQSPGPVGPGTYPVGQTGSVDTMVTNVGGDLTTNDTVCSQQSTSVNAGTVTITEVGGGRVKGSLDLTFVDQSTLVGEFDVGTCAYSFDLCAMIANTMCPGGNTCVP